MQFSDPTKEPTATSNRIFEELRQQREVNADNMLVLEMLMSNMAGVGVAAGDALAEARQLGLSDGWPDSKLLGSDRLQCTGGDLKARRRPQSAPDRAPFV